MVKLYGIRQSPFIWLKGDFFLNKFESDYFENVNFGTMGKISIYPVPATSYVTIEGKEIENKDLKLIN